mgnify:CR=1 FL=1
MSLLILKELFIENGKKVIKPELFHYFDIACLAHWIMGDGAKRNKGLTLCTDSFTLNEVIILMNILVVFHFYKI